MFVFAQENDLLDEHIEGLYDDIVAVPYVDMLLCDWTLTSSDHLLFRPGAWVNFRGISIVSFIKLSDLCPGQNKSSK